MNGKGGKKMKKSILEIYAYAVCFFTIACFVITLGMALWNVGELIAPELTMSAHEYNKYQTDDSYLESLKNTSCYRKEPSPLPQGAELTKKRMEAFALAIQIERRSALQNLVKEVIVLLIVTPVFIIHWRLAAKARKKGH
jgi:hypothetical protein